MAPIRVSTIEFCIGSIRTPSFVISRCGSAFSFGPQAALRVIGRRCSAQIRHIILLPDRHFGWIFCRRFGESVVQPAMPFRWNTRSFHSAGIDYPAPLAVFGLVISIAEGILPDGIAVKPGGEQRAGRRVVPPYEKLAKGEHHLLRFGRRTIAGRRAHAMNAP